MKNKFLINIVGPTAIGKTALAIQVAEFFNTEIISADSRQFYKEMQIGTAVPDKEELAQAKHHFIQHISIKEPYSVGDFELDALAKLQQLFKDKKVVVMVGGSGLYSKSVIKGLDNFPEVAPEIRENLNHSLENNGLESLQQELQEKDPLYFNKIDTENPHRIIRALEICRASGRPYSSFLNQPKPEREFQTITVGLSADRVKIYSRINLRVDQMIKNGLVQEAKTLLPERELNALNTVGYKELFAYFEGLNSLETAIEEIKKNTRRFAKRQLTWFRKDPSITWFDFETPTSHICKNISEVMGGKL